MTLQSHTLSNGLTLIGEPRSAAHSMAAGFFVRTGSRDETPEVSGVSHFLEHMMFKGTFKRSPEDVNREFDEMGAQYNAFTSEENTVYYGAVLPEFQDRLLDLLSDMMRPALRAEDFNMEKNVILEEIALYQDRPRFMVMDMARELFFNEHPLGNSVLGSPRSIRSLECDQMKSYFGRRYSPGNITLVLVGNYQWEQAVSMAESHCGEWPAVETPRERTGIITGTRTLVATNQRLAQAHVAFGFPGVSAQDENRFSADILSDVIGSGSGSRLYWELVEPGLASSAQLYHEELDGAGWFSGYVACEPSMVEEVRSRFLNVLATVSTRNITADEVARSTRKATAGHVIHGEVPMGRLTSVGFDWVYRGHVQSVDEEADALLRVTADQCNLLLESKPFETATTAVLGPVSASLKSTL